MAKTKSKTAPLKKTRTFNGKRYTKKASHAKKSTAKQSAEAARNAGKSARVTHSKSHGYTVYTRG